MKKILALLLLLSAQASAQGIQFHKQWSWTEVKDAPGVNPAEVAWLAGNLSDAERARVLSLVSALSQPEAAQLLPHYVEFDGTRHFQAMTGRNFLDSLRVRPPSGAAGVVRVSYLVSRARAADLAHRRTGGTYKAEFAGNAFSLKQFPKLPIPRNTGVAFKFNMAPAETVLAIVRTPDRSAREIMPRISTQAFDYLIRHHNQSFYPIPTTREQLALSLEAATSTDPVPQLYRYANPRGLYHYTDVATHQQQYRDVIETLKANETALAAQANLRLAPFLPPGTQVTRTLSFYFADGSDGWAIDSVAAIVLEYYKDDYERLLENAVHELYHVAQAAVPKAKPVARSGVDSLLARALNYALNEGTAFYVAPGVNRTAEQEAARVTLGVAIVDSIAMMTTVDPQRATALLNRGVASGGPFYSLGSAMSKVIVDAYGPQGLADTLRDDGVAFFKTFLRAVKKTRGANFFPAHVVQRINGISVK